MSSDGPRSGRISFCGAGLPSAGSRLDIALVVRRVDDALPDRAGGEFRRRSRRLRAFVHQHAVRARHAGPIHCTMPSSTHIIVEQQPEAVGDGRRAHSVGVNSSSATPSRVAIGREFDRTGGKRGRRRRRACDRAANAAWTCRDLGLARLHAQRQQPDQHQHQPDDRHHPDERPARTGMPAA